MNKLIFVCMIALTGCSHNEPPAVSPSQPSATLNNHQHDNFDTAGEYAASGSRWVWNKTQQMYQLVTSEDSKAKYRKVWQATKETGKKAYNATKEAIKE